MTIRYLALPFLMACGALQVACNKEPVEVKASDLDVDIIEYGVYQYPGQKIIVDAPDTPAGYKSKTQKGKKFTFIRQTDTVNMEQGIVFGYKVRVESLPENVQHTFVLKYEYPPMTTHDGNTSTGFEQQQHAKTESGTIEGGIYYVLSEDFEMVPGEWDLSVLYKGKEVARKTFTLVE